MSWGLFLCLGNPTPGLCPAAIRGTDYEHTAFTSRKAKQNHQLLKPPPPFLPAFPELLKRHSEANCDCGPEQLWSLLLTGAQPPLTPALPTPSGKGSSRGRLEPRCIPGPHPEAWVSGAAGWLRSEMTPATYQCNRPQKRSREGSHASTTFPADGACWALSAAHS